MPVDGEMFRVNKSEDISITCSARGIPPPSIRFLRGGVELNRTGGESGIGTDLASRVQLGEESSSVFMNDGTFMVSRMLTIFNVAEEDAGSFTCEASSTIPELAFSLSDNSVFELVVQSKFLCALLLFVLATFTFGLLLNSSPMLQHNYCFHVKHDSMSVPTSF